MPSIRLPQSAESLLPFCRRADDALENACFDTYAHLVTFAASCGYHRVNGRLPSAPNKFLSTIQAVDLDIFKSQHLFPNLLLMGLGAEGKADIARDEERLCKLVEAFADVGCKYLSNELAEWTPARFHLEVADYLLEFRQLDKNEI